MNCLLTLFCQQTKHRRTINEDRWPHDKSTCLCEYKCITNIKIVRIFIVQKFYSKIEFNVCLYIKKILKNRTLEFVFSLLISSF